jgi:hypothetical protein
MTIQWAFEGENGPRALIVSDDDVLGDLLALNLRRRHVLVERVSAQQKEDPEATGVSICSTLNLANLPID